MPRSKEGGDHRISAMISTQLKDQIERYALEEDRSVASVIRTTLAEKMMHRYGIGSKNTSGSNEKKSS